MPDANNFLYLNLTGGPNVITQIAKTEYRSGKYMIQASSNNRHQLSEVYVLFDDKTAYIRQYDQIYNIDPFVEYSANVDSGNLYLRATTSISNTSLAVYGELYSHPIIKPDKNIDMQNIMELAVSMSAMYPDDNTDHISALTSSLDVKKELDELNVVIDTSIEYMQTAEFNALTSEQKAAYLNDAANSINRLSNELDSAVESDIANYKDMSRKVQAMTSVATVDAAYRNPKVKPFLDKVLKPEAREVFAYRGDLGIGADLPLTQDQINELQQFADNDGVLSRVAKKILDKQVEKIG